MSDCGFGIWDLELRIGDWGFGIWDCELRIWDIGCILPTYDLHLNTYNLHLTTYNLHLTPDNRIYKKVNLLVSKSEHSFADEKK